LPKRIDPSLLLQTVGHSRLKLVRRKERKGAEFVSKIRASIYRFKHGTVALPIWGGKGKKRKEVSARHINMR